MMLRALLAIAAGWLLSWPAAAQTVGVPASFEAPLYAPPSEEWSAALGLSDESSRSAAPLVAELESGLGLDAARFSALPPLEKEAALSLAQDTAKGAVEQKIYELSAQLRSQLGAEQPANREARAKLYVLVVRLREVRDHYSSCVRDDGARSELLWANEQASARAAAVRDAMLGRPAPRAGAPEAASPAGLPPLEPSTAAKKVLESLQNSSWGRKPSELHTLYTGYGFESRTANSSHTMYVHPLFPAIRDTVPKHAGGVAPIYVTTAIRNIRKLERMYEGPGSGAASEDPAPAAEPSLEELQALLPPPPSSPAPESRRAEKPEAPASVEKEAEPARAVREPARIPPAPAPVKAEIVAAPVRPPRPPDPPKSMPERAGDFLKRLFGR